jgi:hydroxyethylthiazole kinase-like uncharacterized protein yjeF
MPASPLDELAATPLDDATLSAWPLPLDEAGDKTARGTALVVAGAPGTAGAALLAGIAALRMGAGRLQIATAEPAATAMSVAVPEAMIIPLPVDRHDAVHPSAAARHLAHRLGAAQAVLVGPGLMAGDGTESLLHAVVERAADDAVIVIDAGGLRTLGELPDHLLGPRHGRLVLTPNRQELAGLLDDRSSGDHADDVRAVARMWGAVVSSFGVVACPDGRWWATSASTPGLGTSGSGDVLAGLVVGAASRSDDVVQAVCWATYVHAVAGCRLSERGGRTSFIARELLEEAPAVLRALEGGPG